MNRHFGVKWPGVWIGGGIFWVGLVIYLSVAAVALPQLPSSIGDKINHAVAYGFLMLWFGQIFHSKLSRLYLAMAFISLGMAMEIAQGALPHRWFDLMDGLANTVGVVLGLILLAAGTDKLFCKLEQWRQPGGNGTG